MQVSILSTSDVHGYVLPDDFRQPKTDKPFGLAKSVTALRENATADVTIVIENGDFLQGSPLTDYAKKTEALTLFKDMATETPYDIQILGNHEFNYGRDFLTEFYATEKRLLNANIVNATDQQPFIGQPYRIIEKNGAKIAVIGVTTKFVPNWETEAHITGLEFLDPVVTVKKYVQQLRPLVDVVVVAYHGGIERDVTSGTFTEPDTGENQGFELAEISGVDAVVTGHQHRKIATEIAGTPLTQPGYRGEAIGKITLELDENNQITQRQAELIDVGNLPMAVDIETMVAPLQGAADTWLDAPITTLPEDMQVTDHLAARLHGHPYLDLVNTVQMAVSGTTIASTALFNNEVQGLKQTVTRRDIMTNYIYPNEVVVQKLTGQDIKDALEVNADYFVIENHQIAVNPKYLWPKVSHYNYDIWSGIQYTFDLHEKLGERVTQLTDLNGIPLDMAQSYEVAMNQYRATGAGGFDMFNAEKTIREIPGSMTEHLITYLSQHGHELKPAIKNLTIRA